MFKKKDKAETHVSLEEHRRLLQNFNLLKEEHDDLESTIKIARNNLETLTKEHALQQERLEARLQQESTRASELNTGLISARAEIDDADRRERENVRTMQAELAAEEKSRREAEQNLLRVRQETDEKIAALSSGPGRPAGSKKSAAKKGSANSDDDNSNDDGSSTSTSEDDDFTPVAKKPPTPARGTSPQQLLRTIPDDGSQTVAQLEESHRRVAQLEEENSELRDSSVRSHEQLASLKSELDSAIETGNRKGVELQKVQSEKDIFEHTCEDQKTLLSEEQDIREGLEDELKKTKRKHDDLVAEVAALSQSKTAASDKDRQVTQSELREARRKVEDLTTELLESRKSSEKAKGDLEKQNQEDLRKIKAELENEKDRVIGVESCLEDEETSRTELEAQLAAVQESMTESKVHAESSQDDLNRELLARHNRVEQLIESNSKLEHVISSKETAAAAAREEAANSAEDVAQYRTKELFEAEQHGEARREVVEAKRNISTLEVRLEAAERSMQSTEAALQQKGNEAVSTLQRTVSQEQGRSLELQKQCDKLKADLDQAEVAFGGLEDDVENEKKKATQAEKALAASEASSQVALQALRREHTEENEEMRQLQDTHDALNASHEALEEGLTISEAIKDELESELKAAEDDLEAARTDLSTHKLLVTRLEANDADSSQMKSELVEAEKVRDSLESKLASETSKLGELQELNSKVLTERMEERRQLEELQRDKVDLVNARDGLQAQLSDIETRRNEVSSKLDASQNDLKAKEKEHQNQVQRLAQEVVDEHQSMLKVQASHTELKSAQQQLENKLSDAVASNGDLSTRLKDTEQSLESTAELLKKQGNDAVKALQQSLDDERSWSLKLKTTNTELNQEQASLERLLQTEEASLISAQGDLAQQRAQADEAHGQQRSDVSALRSELTQEGSELTQVRLAKEQLMKAESSKFSSATREQQDLEAALEQASSHAKDLQSELSEAKDLKQRNAVLTQQCSDLEKRLRTSDGARDDLNAKLAQAESAVATSKQNMALHELEKIRNLEAANAELDHELQKNRKLEASNAELDQANRHLKAQAESTVATSKQSMAQRDVHELEKIRKLEATNAELDQANRDLKAKLGVAQGNFSKASADVQEEQKRNERLQQEKIGLERDVVELANLLCELKTAVKNFADNGH